jgi:hypothetical protein
MDIRTLINIVENQSLSEGVIKVPPVLLDQITKELVMRVLWSLSWDGRKDKAFLDIVEKECVAFGVSLPSTRPKLLDTMIIPLDLSGLPANYKSKWGTRSTIKLIFSSKTSSSHEDVLAAVRPDQIGGMKEFFDVKVLGKNASYQITMWFQINHIIKDCSNRMNASNKNVKFNFHHILERLVFLVRHELQHVVQASVFGKKNEDGEYNLRDEEFDPQITDGIDELVHAIRTSRDQGFDVNVRATIKTYLSKAVFFRAIFHSDPERYRTAVRKLYVGVVDALK